MYLSSTDYKNKNALSILQHRMVTYYSNPTYHDVWIKGYNVNWQSGVHNAQIEMCKYIPRGSSVLEIGCGSNTAQDDISSRVDYNTHIAMDISARLGKGKRNFVVGKAEKMPLQTASIDIVIALFLIEHLVFPVDFLDEAWRVILPCGSLIIISPDFIINAMPSEKIGFSYGSGREKLVKLKLFDAIMTAYDTRIRIHIMRFFRKISLRRRRFSFPILTNPRCFSFDEFIPDCDAVYPVCPNEIDNYLSLKSDYKCGQIFYKDKYIFGMIITKSHRGYK